MKKKLKHENVSQRCRPVCNFDSNSPQFGLIMICQGLDYVISKTDQKSYAPGSVLINMTKNSFSIPAPYNDESDHHRFETQK